MKITVKYFLEYEELSGSRYEEFSFDKDKISVREVFRELKRKYNIKYEDVLNKGIILVNDRSVTQLDRENTLLKDGDRLILMPMISGG
ncbi:MAG: ThiS family [Halanaerobiales bacterium]|nr:ThiS family [Halanaerobiales bacterium]